MHTALVFAAALLLQHANAQPFSGLVTFGDSYTDARIPAADGGIAWPIYAASYANASLYPFAKSGATCSNNITYRPSPPVFESQLPAYFDLVENGTLVLDANETLYSLWIGTNDVGAKALLDGSSVGNLDQVTACMVNWVKVMYEAGVKNFLFQNMIPLNLTPMYSPDAYLNRYYPFPHNTTEFSVFINELVTAGNALTRLRLDVLVPSLPDAHVGYFDSYALFTDMYNNPSDYLNGTLPANVTGVVRSCRYNDDGTQAYPCTEYNGTDRDSFLWYDELHPSEQAERILAGEVAGIISGEGSDYLTWLS